MEAVSDFISLMDKCNFPLQIPIYWYLEGKVHRNIGGETYYIFLESSPAAVVRIATKIAFPMAIITFSINIILNVKQKVLLKQGLNRIGEFLFIEYPRSIGLSKRGE